MSPTFYYTLHVAGIAWLFASLGGMLVWAMNGQPREDNGARKLLAASHGVALLLLLVSGFGLMAKLQLPMTAGWFHGKLTLWLLFGALIAVIGKKPELARPLWFALPLLGALAVWLAEAKPF